MAKLTYPAIFKPNSLGGIYAYFPDIEGCAVDGKDYNEAVKHAEDALFLMLSDPEVYENQCNPPSSIENLIVPEKATIVDITVNCSKNYPQIFPNNISIMIKNPPKRYQKRNDSENKPKIRWA